LLEIIKSSYSFCLVLPSDFFLSLNKFPEDEEAIPPGTQTGSDCSRAFIDFLIILE
jgi:hypothetical protein